jgi:predicted histone-like DNA-binding protein
MAVYYNLLQNKNPKFKSAFGKWYARAVHMETVETNELAMMMQQNCTLKRSDIVAVISELVDTMTREMQNGKRIRLDGLGTFKIGLTSEGVSDPKDFRPERHVKGTHVLFYPETHVMRDGQRLRALLTGTKAQELPVQER